MIYYRTIWDTGKNFGGAINREMELIPNANDWIVLLDGDTMFLTTDWGRQVELIISNNPTYAIIGGMLSRCNVPDQLHDSSRMCDFNLLNHRTIAENRWKWHSTDVEPTNGPVAAACMMFQKGTWQANRFQENTVHFDSLFTHKVRHNGGRIGIAHGLYLAHLYRPWAKINPGNDYKHLIK
jgi:hypothetical protein